MTDAARLGSVVVMPYREPAEHSPTLSIRRRSWASIAGAAWCLGGVALGLSFVDGWAVRLSAWVALGMAAVSFAAYWWATSGCSLEVARGGLRGWVTVPAPRRLDGPIPHARVDWETEDVSDIRIEGSPLAGRRLVVTGPERQVFVLSESDLRSDFDRAHAWLCELIPHAAPAAEDDDEDDEDDEDEDEDDEDDERREARSD